MAEVLDATLTPGKVDLVAGWIGRQRWYAAKGRAEVLFETPTGRRWTTAWKREGIDPSHLVAQTGRA